MDESPILLKCPECGNTDVFLEVMKYESHVVYGRLVYLHLAEAETDYYRCLECLEEIPNAAVEERL